MPGDFVNIWIDPLQVKIGWTKKKIILMVHSGNSISDNFSTAH
jgi:hypothetical protein